MAIVHSLICWGGRLGKTVSLDALTDVVTLTNHGLRNGTKLWPSGTLPAELSVLVPVYARSTAANTFTLHTSSAGAIANTGQILFGGSSTYAAVVLKSDLVANAASALAAYGLSDLSRWGSSGSERIYDKISSWNSARSSASSLFDTEVLEIGEAFDDINGGSTTFAFKAASMVLITTINDIRTPGFHNGVIGAGFIASDFTFTATRSSTVFDGFTKENHSYGSVNLSLQYTANSIVSNMILWHRNAAPGYPNLDVTSAGALITNNIIIRGTNGISHYGYQGGCVFSHNTIIGCSSTAMLIAANDYSFYYNNICIGNTTNWPAINATVLGAAGNGGESGNTPFDTVGSTSFVMATTDFVNWDTSSYYANCNLKPANSSSPQVGKGVRYYDDFEGVFGYDIIGLERPNYNNGGSETIDSGAFEFDRGYGNHPASHVLALDNVVVGSRVFIRDQSDTVTHYDQVASGSTVTATITVYGDSRDNWRIKVRKASAAPYYQPYETLMTATPGASSIYVSQIPDE